MNVMQQQQLMTPGEVAEILNVCPQTLWRWRKQGSGPEYVRLGEKTVRYLPIKTIIEQANAEAQ